MVVVVFLVVECEGVGDDVADVVVVALLVVVAVVEVKAAGRTLHQSVPTSTYIIGEGRSQTGRERPPPRQGG